MLPVSLSGKVRAYPSGITETEYRRAAQLCAGQGATVDDRGDIFGWEEKSVLTFGRNVWYKDATDLALQSFLAIGVPRTNPLGENRFVAAISAFPAVSSNLAARLPRALQKVSTEPVTPSVVRAKLGKLVKNGGEPLATDILSLDFLLENGSRITIQKGTAKMLRAREDLLRVEKEDSIPTTSKSGWLNEPGLECLTLQGTHGNISITRDFSIEMLDVAADLSDVAKSLSELIDLVGPYLEVESLSADQAASASD